MKKFIVIIFSVIISSNFQNLSAQDENLMLSRFRLLMTNGTHIEGEDGILTNASLTGTSLDGEKLNIPVEQIRALDQSTGSQALKGAGIGAGIGLVTSLLTVLYAESDPTRELKVNSAAFIGITTASGGLIGFLIGSASDTWERVPLQSQSGKGTNHSQLSIKIYF